MSLRRLWMGALVALTATAAVAQPNLAPAPAPKAPAVTSAPAVVTAPASSTPVLTQQDLEAWLDGLMPYALERGDVAGAVVTVVKDGQPLLAKGYGYADVAKRQPVSPDATLFRPGSISKLFTWTAVMQLVAAGKIDLDRDINAYLDFKIPARPDGPITMRRLMTHTPGFEEQVQGLIGSDLKTVPGMEENLKRWIPKRVYAAGSTPAYSNYGATLAGYIVQRVSGQPYDDYIEQHIFQPLGMAHSSFRQPLPPALYAAMSKGYENASGEPKPYEYINGPPAGALAATGADMARFMNAHLQDQKGAGLLLPPTYAHMMHDSTAPGLGPLNRMALGFYHSDMNGHRIISHGGDLQWFHSDLNLFIDDGIGIFISVNSPGRDDAGHQIRGALLKAFADRYFPAPIPDGKVPADVAKKHAAMIAGIYDNTRRSHSDWVSVVNLISGTKVVPNKDGTITVSSMRGLNGQPLKWREVSPFVWRDVAGQDRLAAVVKDGKVVRFSTDQLSAIMAFEPSPGYRSSGWLLPAVLASVAALALTALLWPIVAIVRRRYRVPFALTGHDAMSYRASRIAAVVALLVPVGWGVVVTLAFAKLDLLGPAIAPWLWILGVLGPVALLAALAVMVWDAANVWRGRRGWSSWFARLWSVVLVLSVLVLMWTAFVFHLFGPNTHY